LKIDILGKTFGIGQPASVI